MLKQQCKTVFSLAQTNCLLFVLSINLTAEPIVLTIYIVFEYLWEIINLKCTQKSFCVSQKATKFACQIAVIGEMGIYFQITITEKRKIKIKIINDNAILIAHVNIQNM